jgi:hypothetical protein
MTTKASSVPSTFLDNFIGPRVSILGRQWKLSLPLNHHANATGRDVLGHG